MKNRIELKTWNMDIMDKFYTHYKFYYFEFYRLHLDQHPHPSQNSLSQVSGASMTVGRTSCAFLSFSYMDKGCIRLTLATFVLTGPWVEPTL